jgi:hypothetical protein
MKLSARTIDLRAGDSNIVILNKEDSNVLGLRPLDRVRVKFGDKEIVAIVDETTRFAHSGEIVTNDNVTNFLGLKGGEELEVAHECQPESMTYIKQKIAGFRLEEPKIRSIIEDSWQRRYQT